MNAFPVRDTVSGWRLALEQPPPAAEFSQTVLTVTLQDEITLGAPLLPPAASTTTIGLVPRCTASGLAGLVGAPLARWQAGYIAGAALQIGFAGPGYLPLALTASLGPQPLYPDAFTPAQLGTVALHRAPVTIYACVVGSDGKPITGAQVTLDGIWPTLVDLATAAAAPPNAIAIASPLYLDRPAGATVAQCGLTALAAPKTLLCPGNVGDASVRLSDQIALVAGTVLAIDAQDPGRAEYLPVASITNGGTGPAFPATAVFPVPLGLTRPHAQGATVTPMTSGALGAANALSQPARAGDVTLITGALAGITGTAGAPAPLVVSGAGADEYHIGSLYDASSGIGGSLALPPIHRLAQLRLRVHAASQATDLLQNLLLPFATDSVTRDLVFP